MGRVGVTVHYWMAQCPGHDDSDPSLLVKPRRDGRDVRVECFAGCDYRDVLAAIGLRLGDLNNDDDGMRAVYRPNIDYVYPNGERHRRRTRPDGTKTVKWPKGKSGGDGLYFADRIPKNFADTMDDRPTIYLCESEKAAQAIWAYGGVAVATGGATRTELDYSCLRGADVIAATDRDASGLRWAAKVDKKLAGVAASVRFVRAAVNLEKADVVEHFDHEGTLDDLDEFDPATTVYDDAKTVAGNDNPPEEPAEPQHTAHLGIAIELARRYHGELLHVHSTGWHYWDGTRWAYDDIGAAHRAVYATLRALWIEAWSADKKTRRAIVADVMRCETASGVLGVLTLARALPEFAATTRVLDADPWLFNCANGTLDLRSGELRDHDPADRITRIAAAAYRTDAPAPPGRHSSNACCPTTRAFMQRLIGLSLLGEVNGDKQLAPITYGEGANGKTTLVEAVCFAMGNYAAPADPTLLLTRRGEVHPTGQADLFGRRLVSTTETERGARFDLALLKRLTGGDTLKARFMRQNFFEFQPSHLLLMATNQLPEIDDCSEAVWRRIRVIPFTVTIPRDERDEHLRDKLRLEADAVLRWIIEGWNAYRRDGLAEPEAVLLATGEYRDEADAVGRFITECCDVGGAQSAARTAALFDAWEKWRANDGGPHLSKIAFGRQLDAKGYPVDQKAYGRP